jgi:hypothetical protein
MATVHELEYEIADDGTETWRVLRDTGNELQVLIETADEAEARRLFDELVKIAKAARA